MVIVIKCAIKGKGNSYCSNGIYDKGKILVKKDSKINLKDNVFEHMTKEARKARTDKNIVDDTGKVLKDVWFNSASSAAQFVTGNSTNGMRQWKTIAEGKSLNSVV